MLLLLLLLQINTASDSVAQCVDTSRHFVSQSVAVELLIAD